MQDDQNTNPATGKPQHPLANYQFSPEEMRVLRECDDEAFYQRCLPIGSIFGIGAYLGIKQGYLKPSLKYGAVPKVMVGAIIGYFLGKLSYRRQCIEKFMRLPNSGLGEMLRQQQERRGLGGSGGRGVGGGLYGFGSDGGGGLGMGMSLNPFSSNANDIYSDEHLQPPQQKRNSSLNLDTENRPTYAGLDDIYRPTLDSPVASQIDPDIPLEPVKPGMSYEELRQRNREEYARQQRQKSLQSTSNSLSSAGRTASTSYPDYGTASAPSSSSSTADGATYNRNPHPSEPIRSGRTNKYGDALSD